MRKPEIPTAVSLQDKATELLQGIERTERDAWMRMKPTQAVFMLLEASRMGAIEMMEQGAVGENLTQLMAQSGLARTLMEDVENYIFHEEDESV